MAKRKLTLTRGDHVLLAGHATPQYTVTQIEPHGVRFYPGHLPEAELPAVAAPGVFAPGWLVRNAHITSQVTKVSP
jgi:hypothetical protein